MKNCINWHKSPFYRTKQCLFSMKKETFVLLQNASKTADDNQNGLFREHCNVKDAKQETFLYLRSPVVRLLLILGAQR